MTEKNPWITKDGYHIDDILVRGRCLWCGKLAQPEYDSGRKTFCSNKCKGAWAKVPFVGADVPKPERT